MKTNFLHFHNRRLRFDKSILRSLYKSVGSFVEQICMRVGF
jgi:hypothetical protein